MNALFHEMWEARLKRSPEFASALGDRRYNDQLSDMSPRAVNDELQREQEYLLRLAAIDTTGLSEQEKLSAELMERELVEDQEGARFKEWELPVNQFHGIHTDLPSEVVDWPFATVKDYDDYIARLGKMPAQLRQATENLMAGINDGRTQPAYLMEKGAEADAGDCRDGGGKESVCGAAAEVSGEHWSGGSQADFGRGGGRDPGRGAAGLWAFR